MRRFAAVVFLTLALAFVAVIPAFAQITSEFTIDILPSFPTYNRTFYCSELSEIGDDVYYTVIEVTVSADGEYWYEDLSVDDDDPSTPDGYINFYPVGGFDPASPTTDCLATFDDADFVYLAAGNYLMVVTTFENGETGPFSFYFDGPGTIGVAENTPVSSCRIPLPSTRAIFSVPAGAPAFYAPDLAAQTNFNLPAGTWWVTDFEGDFAQVWIACQANMIWIPTNAIDLPR